MRRRSVSPLLIDSRGSILIMALWSISLLAVFAVTIGYQVRQKITLVRRLDDRSELRSIADAGVRRAMAEIRQEPKERGYDCMSNAWSNNELVFKDVNIGSGTFNVCYNYLDEFSGKITRRYGMVDEESKLNVNKAGHAAIGRLLRSMDIGEADSQDLAASIEDWRDADSAFVVPLGSAEDQYYNALTAPYEAKDTDFEAPDELLLVKGMTRPLYDKLSKYITVYGSGKVNINTASRNVLYAVGVDSATVDKIMQFRPGKDGVLGTVDDNLFDGGIPIAEKLAQAYKMSQGDIDKLSAAADQYLAAYSTVFSVSSEARISGKQNSVITSAVIDRKGGVIYWQEI